jgi:hypothetical protein
MFIIYQSCWECDSSQAHLLARRVPAAEREYTDQDQQQRVRKVMQPEHLVHHLRDETVVVIEDIGVPGPAREHKQQSAEFARHFRLLIATFGDAS